MKKLFDLENPVFQAISRLTDLTVLGLLCLACCVPVVTFGPAVTALFRAVYDLTLERGGGAVKTYFRAFRDNFRQALPLWLLTLLAGGATACNLFIFSSLPGALGYLRVLFGILAVIGILMSGYLFPLTALFRNSTLETLKNALSLSLGYLPRSVLVAVVNALPFALLLLDTASFFYAGFLWIAVYFSAGAYLNSLLLRKVFAPFLPEDAFAPEESD